MSSKITTKIKHRHFKKDLIYFNLFQILKSHRTCDHTLTKNLAQLIAINENLELFWHHDKRCYLKNTRNKEHANELLQFMRLSYKTSQSRN